MPKFILLYNGPATPQEEMSEEQSKAAMAKWGEWMEKAKSSIVDIGTPLANGASVVDDGSEGTPTEMSGYSIVQADNLEAAKALVDGHPFLSDKTGKFSIEIFEMLPVPGM